MNEARRIMRYVFPGLSFAVQFILFVWLLVPQLADEIVNFTNSKADIGIVFVAFLASGGLGYMYSIMHHTLHGFCGAIDHSAVIQSLRENDILQLINTSTTEVIPITRRTTRSEAWSIATSIWHERRESNIYVKGMDERAKSLTDLVHSIGTARVASAMAMLLSLVYVWIYAIKSDALHDKWRFIVMIISALILVALQECAYRRAGRSAQMVIDQTIYDALLLNSDKEPLPIRAHIILPNSNISVVTE